MVPSTSGCGTFQSFVLWLSMPISSTPRLGGLPKPRESCAWARLTKGVESLGQFFMVVSWNALSCGAKKNRDFEVRLAYRWYISQHVATYRSWNPTYRYILQRNRCWLVPHIATYRNISVRFIATYRFISLYIHIATYRNISVLHFTSNRNIYWDSTYCNIFPIFGLGTPHIATYRFISLQTVSYR
jgi:hypothetical protein